MESGFLSPCLEMRLTDAAGDWLVCAQCNQLVGLTTTDFLYDGIEAVQELSGGTPTANLLTGVGIDEVLLRTDAAGGRSFLADGLGSTLSRPAEIRMLASSFRKAKKAHTPEGRQAYSRW